MSGLPLTHSNWELEMAEYWSAVTVVAVVPRATVEEVVVAVVGVGVGGGGVEADGSDLEGR